MGQTAQTFSLYNARLETYYPMEDSLNIKPKSEIKDKIQTALNLLNWDTMERYVAIGNWGDCIIYENGSIDLVSDSG